MESVSFVLCLLCAVPATPSAKAHRIPSVTDYFTDLKGDATKVNWAHAVNSRELLARSLADSRVMMLEADVVIGTLEGGTELMPIMAHPPLTASDLSLSDFISGVVRAQATARKGIKLDFKTTAAFHRSLPVIAAVEDNLTFPVWFNADIVRGPVESETVPVDARAFLSESASTFPEVTLSLGWTTRYGPDVTGPYTEEQVNDMWSVIEENKVAQPITFAVRAGILSQDWHRIRGLVDKIDELQKSNETTLTVWMSTDTDPVNLKELKRLVISLGRGRVYLDVPDSIRNELVTNDSTRTSALSLVVLVALVAVTDALFVGHFTPRL